MTVQVHLNRHNKMSQDNRDVGFFWRDLKKKKKPGRLIRLETQGMKLEGLFRAAIPSCVGVSREL